MDYPIELHAADVHVLIEQQIQIDKAFFYSIKLATAMIYRLES
jgi:hypothetical protein